MVVSRLEDWADARRASRPVGFSDGTDGMGGDDITVLREAASHRPALERTWHTRPARHTDSPRHDPSLECCTPGSTNSDNNKNKPNYKTQRRASQCMHAPEGPSSTGETRESPTVEAAPETTVLPERRDRQFWES